MRLIIAAVSALALFSSSAALAAPTAAANKSFLAANAKKKGVVAVPGIQYRVLASGKGALVSSNRP